MTRRRAHGDGVLPVAGVRLGIAAWLLAAAAPVAAATAQTTIAVSATIVPTCNFTATTLAFGLYAGVQNDATATITATCTNTTTYAIGINAGVNPGGSYYQWNLAGPSASLLAYRLYRDAARSILWGGAVGYDTVAGTGNGAPQAIAIYGRELGGQFVQPGAYTDTVTLILYY